MQLAAISNWNPLRVAQSHNRAIVIVVIVCPNLIWVVDIVSLALWSNVAPTPSPSPRAVIISWRALSKPQIVLIVAPVDVTRLDDRIGSLDVEKKQKTQSQVG